jgi:hypothetical protein
MSGSEPAGFLRPAFDFGDVPAPVFVLHEFDLGFGGKNAHAFPDVLRNGDLAFAYNAHDDYQGESNTLTVVLYSGKSKYRERKNIYPLAGGGILPWPHGFHRLQGIETLGMGFANPVLRESPSFL